MGADNYGGGCVIQPQWYSGIVFSQPSLSSLTSPSSILIQTLSFSDFQYIVDKFLSYFIKVSDFYRLHSALFFRWTNV